MREGPLTNGLIRDEERQTLETVSDSLGGIDLALLRAGLEVAEAQISASDHGAVALEIA